MLARDPSLLQALPHPRAAIPPPPALGIPRAGQDRRAGEGRGRAGDAARAGAEPGLVRAGGARRRADADCEREPDGVGGRAWAEERRGSGDGGVEAFVTEREEGKRERDSVCAGFWLLGPLFRCWLVDRDIDL